ncbi:LytTR family DNA-binding domain-containing protein [Dyadobacter sp. 3J3]|uniref:LytR/AlgR family response regulator transcription factor n=1 Tax=Dyadobacter sp. 3J3 TaxID=2606600 RepID=UPI00135B8F81|nr:LytTR family DNA-binding domain-containing protein [Dyadobacter sp. 3J3]
MKVLIIEDESQTAKRLEDLILRYDPTIRLLGIIPSVQKTLAYFDKPQAIMPDLLFMDIHLEDELSFRILEELKFVIPVIFTTAFDEYALRAFKNFSIDYLLKPIDFEELCEAIEKFKLIVSTELKTNRFDPLLESFSQAAYKDRFMVSSGTRLKSIPVTAVAYFSYERKNTLLNTSDGKYYSLDYSLDKLLEVIDPKLFFRVNRTHIVALTAIVNINQFPSGKLLVQLDPETRDEVFLSADRTSAFKAWLGK